MPSPRPVSVNDGRSSPLSSQHGFVDAEIAAALERNDALDSAITGAAMDPKDTAKLYGAEYNRIKDDFEDEYQDLDFNDIPPDYRRRYVEGCEANKEKLKQMIQFFYLHPDLAGDDVIKRMKSLKMKHLNTLKAAWESLKVTD